MKRFESVFAMSFVLGFAVGCGTSASGTAVDDESAGVAEVTEAVGSTECRIRPEGTAFCTEDSNLPISGRPVFYRVGATSGPGYDAATGRHAAVFLFQGTSFNASMNNNGPEATWSKPISNPGNFGVWFQVATVIALIDSGYTVIQPAARDRGLSFAWDANFPVWKEPNDTSGKALAPDQVLMNALIAALQPSSTTFGPIDINHVYAMGISSGGYMSARMANEYSSGINAGGAVNVTSKPFRAVAINSAAYYKCGANSCPAFPTFPATHAPTFFLHDKLDPVVDFDTMQAYYDALGLQFPNDNPAYTVGGVREQFRDMHVFDGVAPPSKMVEHHQWDDDLKPDSTNFIVDWFAHHR